VADKPANKREGWTYINLPKELAGKIDRLIESKLHGYRSRGDFIADAVRRRLDELRKPE
jgi:metal-responsive CopG/Arc/MetJ family transcriptional regulator